MSRARILPLGCLIGWMLQAAWAAAGTPQESSPVPAHGNPVAPADWNGMGRYQNTWDLELGGSLGAAFGESEVVFAGAVEGRLGALWLRGTSFHALGVITGWMQGLGPWSGVEMDWSSTRTGLWMQLATGWSLEERLVGKVAAGFSLFGVDARLVSGQDAPTEWLLFGHVRVPVRLLLLGLTGR